MVYLLYMDYDAVINVPDNATIVVKTGTVVGCSSPLYEINKSIPTVVPVSELLHCKPEDIFHVLVHVIGDSVKEHDVIAQKKGVIGKKKVYAPVAGVIDSIDHNNGTITLNTNQKESEVKLAQVEGIIKQIDTVKNTILITIVKGIEFDVNEISGEGGGEISLISHDFETIDISMVHDKIVLIKTIFPALASKFDALGAIGIVYESGNHTADIPYVQLKHLDDFIKLESLKNKKMYFITHKKKILVY